MTNKSKEIGFWGRKKINFQKKKSDFGKFLTRKHCGFLGKVNISGKGMDFQEIFEF